MGQEETQRHSFDCRQCGEPITVRMDVDYEKLATPITMEHNAELADEVAGAPIVNLDAGFLIPEDAVGADMSFFRLDELRKRVQKAIKRGTFVDVPSDEKELQFRPFRRPDYNAEWGQIQRVWSLLSRGKDDLADRILQKGASSLYKDGRIKTLKDWLWRFGQFVLGQDYNDRVQAALGSLRLVSPEPLATEFVSWSLGEATQARGERYREILSEFFQLYDEFSQVLFYVQSGVSLAPNLKATSIAFDKTKMFYGNAFETLGTLSELLAVINNIQHGRHFDEFEVLAWADYKKLDKAAVFAPFSTNLPLNALCMEVDNRLRNASHHRRLAFDAKSQTVSYTLGKGGSGGLVKLSYSEYLEKCVRMAFQILSLLLFELALSHSTGRNFPIIHANRHAE